MADSDSGGPGPATSGRASRWPAIAIVAAAACIALSAAVFFQRGVAAWHAGGTAPGVVLTSGYEEESHFALWRALHGQAVFVDSSRFPYASAYFNWLFYSGYAAALRPFVSWAGDPAIVRVGRLLTAAGTLAGAWILFAALRRISRQAAFAAAVATFVFFGPLVGWWAHTVRPDAWALAFEAAGAGAILIWRRERPGLALIASLAFFYAAWSCKQTFFVCLASTVLFLAARAQWRLAAGLLAGWIALCGTTLFLLGPAYRAAQFDTATTNVFSLAWGLRISGGALEKLAPLLVLACGAFFLSGRRPAPSSLGKDARLLGWIGIGIAGSIAFAASCKTGASVNYYFTFSLMLALAGCGSIADRPSAPLQFCVCAIAIVFQMLALAGWVGRVDLDEQVKSAASRWEAFRSLPEPRFTSDYSLELPWLNAHSPPLVLAYNYEIARLAGRQFEAGGVAGLIERGYFAALFLPAEAQGSYLGGDLRGYKRDRTVDGLVVYLRPLAQVPAP
jgi:hypothetical protein